MQHRFRHSCMTMPNNTNFFKIFFTIPELWLTFLLSFLHNIFQNKKVSQWLKFPFSTKGFKVWFFSQILFFFYQQNGWKKKPLANFFKLDALERKGFSLGRRQNGSLNHVLLGRSGLSCANEQVQENTRAKFCSNQTFFIPLESSWSIDI